MNADAAVEVEVVAEIADGEAEVVVDAEAEGVEPVVEFMDAAVEVKAVAEFESCLAFLTDLLVVRLHFIQVSFLCLFLQVFSSLSSSVLFVISFSVLLLLFSSCLLSPSKLQVLLNWLILAHQSHA